MFWTDEKIEEATRGLAERLQIQRMPTSREMRDNKLSGLCRAIGLSGGMDKWSKKLNLPKKQREIIWTDEKITEDILDAVKILQIKRMPSASELTKIGRGDLHNAISRSGIKYSGWTKKLNLESKKSDTKMGNDYEGIVANWIQEMGYKVKRMPTKHPFDLLVGDSVKIDVKAGTAHHHFESRAHTFRPSKKYATCDLYVCVALDEDCEIERTFIIPSKFAQLVTLNIGKESKYNKFIERWDYLRRFIEFYEAVK